MPTGKDKDTRPMISFASRAAVAAFLAISAGAVPAIATAQSGEPDPVVARVNDHEIHFSDVKVAKLGLPAEYREIPLAQIYPALIEQLVNQALITQAAEQENLDQDPQVQQRIAYLTGRVLQEAYLNRRVEAEVTDDALKARYEEFIKTVPANDEVRARHILLKTEQEAKDAIEEIQGGAEFAEVAKARSTGPSASSGGDLGYFTKDQMVPEFAEAAFAMSTGEVSKKPVQTSFGWHVILVVDRRPGAKPSFADSAEQLRTEMTREIVNRLLAELQGTATVERFNMDGSALPSSAE